MFILAAQRDIDPSGSFTRYREYLHANESRFPRSAYQLATSDWYMNPEYHECPHDAWLESLQVEEPTAGARHEIRTVAITVRLLGAYHDGIIEMHYPRVFEYAFNSTSLDEGHRDWRYDEFRVSDKGHLIHEIEWYGLNDTASWLIEASDVHFKWSPFET